MRQNDSELLRRQLNRVEDELRRALGTNNALRDDCDVSRSRCSELEALVLKLRLEANTENRADRVALDECRSEKARLIAQLHDACAKAHSMHIALSDLDSKVTHVDKFSVKISGKC